MPISSKDAIKILERNGWIVVPGGKGSHTKLHKNGVMAIVPQNRELPIGTLTSIEKRTGVRFK
jgi:predicted RNA binding protein YcfA (HicA-like mRNA interferase family)